MGQSSKFWNKMAKKYARTPIKDEAAYQKKLEITRTYFTPESNVLELGCGTGSTALLHAPYVGQIHAIDYASEMIQIAEEKLKQQNLPNLTFECADIDNYHAQNESFDVILGLSLLHLLKNKEGLITNAYKMLKPNGVFITNTACLGDKLWFFKFIGPIGQLFGFFPTIKVFTEKNLITSLKKAGFHIEYQWKPNEKDPAIFIVAKKHE